MVNEYRFLLKINILPRQTKALAYPHTREQQNDQDTLHIFVPRLVTDKVEKPLCFFLRKRITLAAVTLLRNYHVLTRIVPCKALL